MRRRFVALLSLAASAVTSPAPSQATSFTGLGFLPGGDLSSAWAVSADGSTVVGYAGAPPLSEAFRWTRDEGMVGLGTLPGATDSFANGVSADGSVVVGGSNSGPPVGEAFRWTSSDGMVGIGTLPGGDYSNASGVSADGSVVVGGSNSAENTQAFRWTSDGGMVGLGAGSGAQWVSADGSVVVGYSGEAFRWTSDGGMVELGTLDTIAGAGDYSIAYGGSADGSIVVGSSGTFNGPPPAPLVHAYRWTSGGGMVALSSLSSAALAASADGSVVVGLAIFTPLRADAFFWDSANGLRPLQQVLTNDFGLDLTGWALETARGVSADGRTIVGEGTHLGQTEAWIAFIPEPEAPLLLLAALLALAWRARRTSETP